jgi:hypothetical protein
VQLHGLKDCEELHTGRGRQVLLPLMVDGADLDRGMGVVLSARPASGIDVIWGHLSAGTVRPTSALRAGEDAALRIQIDRDALPGRRVLEITARSSDSAAPVNGGPKAHFRIPVVVEPVDVRVQILPGSADWSLLAPIQSAVHAVAVEVIAADGGALPPQIDLAVTAEPPVESVVREGIPAAWPARYTLRVPAQAPPAAGVVRFHAAGDRVRCLQDAVVRIRVKPITLRVSAAPVEVPRYAGALETLFGWLRPEHRFSPEICGGNRPCSSAGCSPQRKCWRCCRLC